MHQGTCGHHVGVQTGIPRKLPVENPAMAIGPIQHRGHAEAPGTVITDQSAFSTVFCLGFHFNILDTFL
jgi:hypothetical protein